MWYLNPHFLSWLQVAYINPHSVPWLHCWWLDYPISEWVSITPTRHKVYCWCSCVIVKLVAMLTDASSATMYANTCGTRIFTTDSASPQPLQRQRRVVIEVVVTGLSSTGVIRLPHLMHALIYTGHQQRSYVPFTLVMPWLHVTTKHISKLFQLFFNACPK